MANTRNSETVGNFALKESGRTNQFNYKLYKNSGNGEASKTRLPGNGFMGARIGGTSLAGNSVDIESFLFGVGSNAVIKTPDTLIPEPKSVGTVDNYKNPFIYMPDPLIVDRQQRPNFF